MKIACIVPTFNRRKLFTHAVESVLAQTRLPDDFLILDNNCTDGTAEDLDALARTHEASKLPRLHVFHEPKNLGASYGMNYLFKRALDLNPDWIWVMDDDAIADKSALQALLDSPEARDPNVYILESTIVDGEGVWSPPNRPATFEAAAFGFHGLPENALDAGTAVQVNTGGYCGLLIRKEAFLEFGFPRAEFYLWYDDVEFVLRVSMKKKVFLIPNSKIRHFAQALVKHHVRWPFSGPLPEVPRELAWRYYYCNRNWLWMAKQFMPRSRFALFWAKHMARAVAAPMLLRQDHLPGRLKFAARAGWDALFDRLGKTIDPGTLP
jgi:rhamnopyranosyl-N-acetylglucosaminyl-diphospho-decaprenol beta-1,3/1,4-galactofuranosyltransferase